MSQWCNSSLSTANWEYSSSSERTHHFGPGFPSVTEYSSSFTNNLQIHARSGCTLHLWSHHTPLHNEITRCSYMCQGPWYMSTAALCSFISEFSSSTCVLYWQISSPVTQQTFVFNMWTTNYSSLQTSLLLKFGQFCSLLVVVSRRFTLYDPNVVFTQLCLHPEHPPLIVFAHLFAPWITSYISDFLHPVPTFFSCFIKWGWEMGGGGITPGLGLSQL